MLNIWPWSRIRELEERLELAEREWKKREEWLGNCAKECRFYENENLRLGDRVNALIERNKNLNDEYSGMMRERDGLLKLLALSPKERKRHRVIMRRWLRTQYVIVPRIKSRIVWRRKEKPVFKVFSPAELPEPLGACPRCSHSDAELIRTEDGLHYVQCRKCGAMTDDCKHAEEAVQLWNEGRVLDE